MNQTYTSLLTLLKCSECFKVLPTRFRSSIEVSHLLSSLSNGSVSQRGIHTSASLQRWKRQQRKYVPKVPHFHYYGSTHRLLRGESVTGERYGPIFDKPDYTYLDGRPTLLSPEQMEQKIERRDQAEKVVKYLQEMEAVKNYIAPKQKEIGERKQALKNRRLKPKS